MSASSATSKPQTLRHTHCLQELLGVQSTRSDVGTPGQNGYTGGKRGSPFQAGPFAERPFTEEGDVDSTPQWGRC